MKSKHIAMKNKQDDRPFNEKPFYQPTKVTKHHGVRFNVGSSSGSDSWEGYHLKTNKSAIGTERSKRKMIDVVRQYKHKE